MTNHPTRVYLLGDPGDPLHSLQVVDADTGAHVKNVTNLVMTVGIKGTPEVCMSVGTDRVQCWLVPAPKHPRAGETVLALKCTQEELVAHHATELKVTIEEFELDEQGKLGPRRPARELTRQVSGMMVAQTGGKALELEWEAAAELVGRELVLKQVTPGVGRLGGAPPGTVVHNMAYVPAMDGRVRDLLRHHRAGIPDALKRDCPDCKGTGEYRGFAAVEPCGTCNGTGKA